MAMARQRFRGFSSDKAIALGLAMIVMARGMECARAAEIDVEQTLVAVARYRYGDDRKPLAALQQRVLDANSRLGGTGVSPVLGPKHGQDARATRGGADDAAAFRRDLADRMASVLTSKQATPAAKAFLCGQIAAIGTEKQAPALASLLADTELAQPALAALAQIPGPAVDRILRDAVETLQGDLRVGTVNALGQRRDGAATQGLAALLVGADEASACAAASALGKIGGDAAAARLHKALAGAKGRVRTEVAHACLSCAERMLDEKKHEQAAAIYAQLSGPDETGPVRMAALRGAVLSQPAKAADALCQALTSQDPALESMAIRLVPEVPGPAATQRFAQCLGKASPPVQRLLLGALAARGDTAARGAVEAAASSQDQEVRLAALGALGSCGDETSAKILMERITAGAAAAEGEAARSSLVRLRGPRVNEALAGMISRQDARAKAETIRILAARNAVGAIADLKKAAEDPDAAVRKESWKALGSLARGQDVASLVDLVVRARDDERDDAEKAVAAVLRRPDRPDVRPVLRKLDAAQPPGAQAALLRILSAAGDDLALPALCKAVQSSDPGVRDAAVRGLAGWPTPAPLDDLVGLARRAQEPVHRVLALRGAIRLWGKATGRTPEQMTGLVTELMQLAGEPAERKAVLAELGRCPTLDALHLAQKHLVDPGLATEAGVAVTQIASALRNTHRDAALKALEPLLAGNRDPAVVGRAFMVLRDVLKPVNLALGATATSPDGLESDGSSGGDRAAIDGDPNTFWDEVDGADLYRLRVTFREPTEVASINILWHPYEQHQAKNLDVLCDGKLVKEVRGAKCFENEMFVALASVRCTSVELVIPGKNGLVSPCIHEFQIFGRFPPQTAGSGAAPVPRAPQYGWKQTGTVLALLNHGRVVWQWNYAANLGKPYFHPVALTDGTVLTAPSPADHPWHRALWFSWKMLNGVNYWEEDAATGKAQGLTEVRAAKVVPNADGSARIETEIDYHPPGAPAVLTESRLIELSAPDAQGAYRIDWRAAFTAGAKDVLLQGGTAGGGYAGLSVRISQASGAWILSDSEGRQDDDSKPANPLGIAANTHGKRARWADFSLVDAATARPGGIAVLDHPANPRHPSAWHNVLAGGARFGYFSPAMLWSEPYRLPAGQRLTLRYRILVHPERAVREAIEKEWQTFASQR